MLQSLKLISFKKGEFNMKRYLKIAGITLLMFVFFLVSLPVVQAETEWQKDHPRRTEVNKRLKNQNRRINQGVKNGELTKKQARKLHKEDHQIRQEERDMASQNGGHITKQEQKTLNQQENATSKQIYNEKHGQ
jgi:CRISPR/Cas system-associated endoribonuclease Cas2